MSDNGFFLVIEGLDGSGKTELSKQLARFLEESIGRGNVKLTFEPYDLSCAGLFIRQVLSRKLQASPKTLALAFAANRSDHVEKEIETFLNDMSYPDRIVICDRYYLSSLVYQTTEHLSMEEVMAFNKGARRPDLTIFLNASDRTCYERMRKRAEDKELFESNLRQTRKKYLEAIEFLRQGGEEIVEVDANGAFQEVINAVIEVLSQHGPRHLALQKFLPIEPYGDFYSLNGSSPLTIQELAQSMLGQYLKEAAPNRIDVSQASLWLQHKITQEIENLSLSDLASLFLDYLSMSGYKREGRLAWTDIDAFELEYKMPLDLAQRGTAILLGNSSREDQVTKKILKSVESVSDFMIVLDPAMARLYEKRFIRDIISQASDKIISPEVRVIDRDTISQAVLKECENILFERLH